MNTVQEIQKAISLLPKDDYTKLRKWFTETDWQQWNEQIASDSKSGGLNFLMKEAFAEKSKNNFGTL